MLGLSPTTPLADIINEISNLSPQDARELRNIYQEKYSARRNNRDLLADISLEIPTLQDRYRAFQTLAPENIHPQIEARTTRSNFASILAEPAGAEVISGSTVKYTFHEGAVIKAPNTPGPFVRYLLRGEDGTLETRTGREFDGHFDKPGVYRITFEVMYPGQPPRYYTLRQIVRAPEDKAREELFRLPGTALDPDLFLHSVDARLNLTEQTLADLRNQVNALRQRDFLSQPQQQIEQLDRQISQLEELRGQLLEIKNEVPAKLFEGSAAKPIPLQATLIPTENSRAVPLQLYAKPLGGNRWAIVDLTKPTDARVYEGAAGSATSAEGLRSAWREFIAANNLPAGQIAALPPRGLSFPGGEIWNSSSNGQSGFQQWASNLGWSSLLLGGAGIIAAVVPGLEGFAVPLFIAAGAAGAGAGGLNIYDRVKYGNFQWNSTETALDMLSIVGGMTGAAGGSAALLRGGSVVVNTVEGASLTFRRLGQFTVISQGVDHGSALASGVIIGTVWLDQIQRINSNPNLSPEQKQQQTSAILQQATMMGGIVVVGGGVSRFRALATSELDTLLRSANFSPELDDLVRNTPGLQRALQEQGADRLRQLYDDFQAGGRNRSGNLRVSTFIEYVSSNGVATRTERIPQTLSQALNRSDEALGRMSVRELNEAVLEGTNPELFAAFRRGDLPPRAQTALTGALDGDYRISVATNFDNARQRLSESVNARLGASVATVDELKSVLSYFANSPSSRGSIGEEFYRTHLAFGAQVEKPVLPRRLYVSDPQREPTLAVRQPDALLINGRRTLDIKTGYESGGIDLVQLKDYNDLINASQRRRGGPLQQLLARQGVPGGRLTGHDYLFLPNAGTSADDAARRAFARIENELQGRTANIRVYYLGDDGKIYQLVKAANGQPEARMVGDHLPN